MHAPVRLRQVVLITADLLAVTARLEAELGLSSAFKDEGVGYFGLENRVLAAGDCFIEVLTPLTTDSAGHRYLDRKGADGGYMAIFQFADRQEPRRRVESLGVRVVWQADLEDMAGTHLDPRDVPGAIVSLDWADPPESWHWAGPAWQGEAATQSAARRPGGICSLEVAVADPGAAAARWAEVLGPAAVPDTTSVAIPEAQQVIRFSPSRGRGYEGIVACGLSLAPADESAIGTIATEIGGVRFVVVPHGPATLEEAT
jgi:hypothetical protein